jgi:hypothetical protein
LARGLSPDSRLFALAAVRGDGGRLVIGWPG